MHRSPAPDLVALGPTHRRLVAALVTAGARPHVSGPAVRDALLGLSSDVLEVEAFGRTGDELRRALANAGFTVREIGQHAPSDLTASADGVDIKVVIAFDANTSIEDAMARRVFTIDALMWDPVAHELVDPWHGRDDLTAGVLRHVSSAFADDPTNVLRAFGYAARFDLELHPDTVLLCRSMHDQYERLPMAVIHSEWSRIAHESATPSRALQALRSTGWLAHLPDLAALDDVPQDPRWHPEGTVDVHVGQVADAAAAIAARDQLIGDERSVLVLGALCHDLGKATHTQIHNDGTVTARGHAAAGVEPTHRLLHSMGMPSSLVEQVVPLVAEHMCAATVPEPSKSAVRRLIRRLGPSSIEMWARVVEADHRGRGAASSDGPSARWVQLASTIVLPRPTDLDANGDAVVPLVTGDVLVALGLQPGPRFRPLLQAALQAQIAGEIFDQNSADQWARSHLAE